MCLRQSVWRKVDIVTSADYLVDLTTGRARVFVVEVVRFLRVAISQEPLAITATSHWAFLSVSVPIGHTD
jgi:hypothetical protein